MCAAVAVETLKSGLLVGRGKYKWVCTTGPESMYPPTCWIGSRLELNKKKS